MSSSKKPSSSSYDSFAQVDELVSKPVLGSDGAAKWQDFRSTSKQLKHNNKTKSSAPSLVMKHVDRVVGFTSLEQERAVEEQVRKKEGHADMGSGYTSFKRKGDAEDAAERKRRKAIRDRIRPDKMTYFIAASTFEGWKHDYVFTTRHRGTGYYWDGMDSVKQLDGKLEVSASEKADSETQTNNKSDEPEKVKKKKKRKRKAVVEESISPLEQVANAIQRRQEQLQQPPAFLRQAGATASATTTATAVSGTLKEGWEEAKDPSSGKTYYFCRATGERSWDRPMEKTNDKNVVLPPGWKATKDPTTQKEYYYHAETGKTSWERPKS